MLGTILGITVPLFYFAALLSIVRYVYVFGEGIDDMDRPVAATLVGIFWPVLFPVFIVVQSAKRERKRREEDRYLEHCDSRSHLR